MHLYLTFYLNPLLSIAEIGLMTAWTARPIPKPANPPVIVAPSPLVTVVYAASTTATFPIALAA